MDFNIPASNRSSVGLCISNGSTFTELKSESLSFKADTNINNNNPWGIKIEENFDRKLLSQLTNANSLDMSNVALVTHDDQDEFAELDKIKEERDGVIPLDDVRSPLQLSDISFQRSNSGVSITRTTSSPHTVNGQLRTEHNRNNNQVLVRTKTPDLMAAKPTSPVSPVQYDLNANTIPRTCTTGMGSTLPTISALAPSALKKSNAISLCTESSQTVVTTRSNIGNCAQLNSHYLLPCSSPINNNHSGPILSNSSASSASPPLDLNSQVPLTSSNDCALSNPLTTTSSIGLPPLITSFNKCVQNTMNSNGTDPPINMLNPLIQNNTSNSNSEYILTGNGILMNTSILPNNNNDSLFSTPATLNGLSSLSDLSIQQNSGVMHPSNDDLINMPSSGFSGNSMSGSGVLTSVSNGQFCHSSVNNGQLNQFNTNTAMISQLPMGSMSGNNQTDMIFNNNNNNNNQFNPNGLLPLAGQLLDGSVSSMNLYSPSVDGISGGVSSGLLTSISTSNAKLRRRKHLNSPDSQENGKRSRLRHTSTVLAAQALIDGSYADSKLDDSKLRMEDIKEKAAKCRNYPKHDNNSNVSGNGSQVTLSKSKSDIHSDSDSEENAKIASNLPLNADASMIRLERKRARNRVAARRCRERKVSLIQSLENEVNQLKQTIDRLKTHIHQYSNVFNSSIDHLSRIADTIPELRDELSRVPIMSRNLSEDINI